MVNRRIAEFQKVSFEQFEKDCRNTLKAAEEVDENSMFEVLKDIYDNLELPRRGTAGSAGYDFKSPFDMILDPGNYVTVPTGIRAIMDSGYFLMLVPRSGLGFKYRLRLSNTVGIVDSDYSNSDNEGHIFIKIVNEGNEQVKIETGDGFAQGIFVPFGLTKDDSVTDDRNGGFGSTDNNNTEDSVLGDILSGLGSLEPLDVVAKKVVEDVETVNAERNEEVKESNE